MATGKINKPEQTIVYNPTSLVSTNTMLGRVNMVVTGEFFFFRAIFNVNTALAKDTELFQLPSYNYDTTTTTNLLVLKADGSDYTTVNLNNTTKRIVVYHNSGMPTGRYELIMFGKCT